VHAVTQYIIGERGSGRTTKLIKWLLEGKEQANYPGWSRVIVCASSHRMVMTTNVMVTDYIRKHVNFHSCDRMLPHTAAECPQVQERFVNNVRKAVWGMSDYFANESGTRQFEFAIDDMEYVWERGARILRRPTLITLEGKVNDSLGD
jgi:hypothetical protein